MTLPSTHGSPRPWRAPEQSADPIGSPRGRGSEQRDSRRDAVRSRAVARARAAVLGKPPGVRAARREDASLAGALARHRIAARHRRAQGRHDHRGLAGHAARRAESPRAAPARARRPRAALLRGCQRSRAHDARRAPHAAGTNHLRPRRHSQALHRAWRRSHPGRGDRARHLQRRARRATDPRAPPHSLRRCHPAARRAALVAGTLRRGPRRAPRARGDGGHDPRGGSARRRRGIRRSLHDGARGRAAHRRALLAEAARHHDGALAALARSIAPRAANAGRRFSRCAHVGLRRAERA